MYLFFFIVEVLIWVHYLVCQPFLKFWIAVPIECFLDFAREFGVVIQNIYISIYYCFILFKRFTTTLSLKKNQRKNITIISIQYFFNELWDLGCTQVHVHPLSIHDFGRFTSVFFCFFYYIVLLVVVNRAYVSRRNFSSFTIRAR